jgi:cobalt/nickel transport system permease protein
VKKVGGLAGKLLVSASSVFEELAPEREPLFSPPLGLALAVAATASASFAKGVTACAAALAGGAVLAAWGKGFKAWISVVLASLLFSLAVTAPLLAITATPFSAAPAASLAALRAVSAASAFTGFTICLGWRGVVEGLRGLGAPALASSLGLLLKYIPIFLRDLAGILAAREARAMRSDLKLSWALLASAAGEVLVRGYARAVALRMALEARSFAGAALTMGRHARFSRVEAALLAYTLAVAASAWWSA